MNSLFIGHLHIKLDETDSTNAYLFSLAGARQLPEGTLVTASYQKKGRGQRGTSWESKKGQNLIMSFFLKPDFIQPDHQFLLSKAVALGVLDTIREVLKKDVLLQDKVNDLSIKWPNDIFFGRQKLAGILIENAVSGSKISYSVIGIGMNVNQVEFQEHLPNAVSIRNITGKKTNLQNLTERLCSFIEGRYLILKQSGKTRIDQEYLHHLYRLDIPSTFLSDGKKFQGVIKGVSDAGKICVELENGKVCEFEVKEIEIL